MSGDEAWNTINDYVNSVAPELVPRMTKYEPAAARRPDVFAVHRIDEQLAKAMDRKVWLPSGGTLVIDRTEAMTVVDVNTGKFTGSGGNLEQTVTRNNLEAAEETVRQLRLRDIGGIIVIDFIDMVLESNRDLVLRRLTEALARDRTRHQVSEVTSLGLVQLTRKKLGTGLIEAFSTRARIAPAAASCCTATRWTPRRRRRAQVGVGRPPRQARQAGQARRPSRDVAGRQGARASAGEHPMFKAMAAANGKHEDDDDDESSGRRPSVDRRRCRRRLPPKASPTEAPTTDPRRRSGDDESDEDDSMDDDDDDEDEDDDRGHRRR